MRPDRPDNRAFSIVSASRHHGPRLPVVNLGAESLSLPDPAAPRGGGCCRWNG